MTTDLRFALNHICAPKLDISGFFSLAKKLGLTAVEIRNDLHGQAILDGTPPETVRGEAEKRGLRIISINALQRFNEWTDERAREAKDLIDYTAACGAKALVLVPVNDGSGRGNGERQANLRIALQELAPLLRQAGVTGLVEPLGFDQCSLRLKSEAASVIQSVDPGGVFALVHDTFHHYLAGEQAIFPNLTGLVHISGVSDRALAVGDMRDEHRLLVDRHDQLGNVSQIKAITNSGYTGFLSFEPFARAVHDLPNLQGAVFDSMRFISREVASRPFDSTDHAQNPA